MTRSTALLATLLAVSAVGCRRHRGVVVGPRPVSAVTAIAVARQRTCVVVSGRVQCVGRADYDDGYSSPHRVAAAPVDVPGIEHAVDVKLGDSFGCALLADRTVRCWGSERHSELGRGTSETTSPIAVAVPDVTDAVQIALGAHHACARLASGDVTCWGSDADKQLQRPGDSFASGNTPGLMRRVSGVVDVQASGASTCVVLRDRTLRCFGTGAPPPNEPVAVGAAVSAVSWQYGDGCVLLVDGEVACRGPLAFGSSTGPGAFARIPDVHGARAIAYVAGKLCAVDAKRTVTCISRRTGPSGSPGELARESIVGPTDVAQIAMTEDHVCTRSRANELWCWGNAEDGQLGDRTDSTSFPSSLPTTIPFAAGARVVVGGHRVCGLAGGAVECFQPRPDDRGPERSIAAFLPRVPTVQPELAGAEQLSVALDHRCFVDAKHDLRCAGVTRPALGFRGKPGLWVAPPEVVLHGVREVVTTDQDTCAILLSDEAKCFGSAIAPFLLGRLPKLLERREVWEPTTVPALRGAKSLSLGAAHGCAIVDAGPVCFGMGGSGQLGDGLDHPDAVVNPVRVAVPAGHVLVQLAAADGHTCARSDKGDVFCWGWRFRSSAGEHSHEFEKAPEKVEGISDAISLSVGRNHACAVRKDGAVLCWGSNDFGQCARPFDRMVERPRVVEGVSGAVEVLAGEQSTCVRLASDAIVCFGDERAARGAFGTTRPSIVRPPTKIVW